MRVHKPHRLRKGDTIGVVAPAWTFDKKHFMEGVETLRGFGYKVKYDSAIFGKFWSMAGHDKERAVQITRMFSDTEVRCIFCANAGYGSIRTLPFIDRRVVRDNPKIFIGYSDITILLTYLHHVARMVVFHGPVVAGELHRDMNPLNIEYLLRAIGSAESFGVLTFPEMRAIKAGRASGVLVGGNLSMIISSLGTPYEVDLRNKILFLEEIDESMESIDNYLMQLKLGGRLAHLRGILIGRMLDCVDRSGNRYQVSDVIGDVFGGINIPILSNFPSGHRLAGELNVTFPLGITVTLDADEHSVRFHGSGVR
jgi:muramoyltetrapeptide carboxypeptidase